MQGFINFASDIGWSISLVLPMLCYLTGSTLFLIAGYGLWQCGKPGSYWYTHRGMIGVDMLIGSILLSFNLFLNEANGTFGSTMTTRVSAAMTSYTPPTVTASGLIGASPEATILNMVTYFSSFFIAYGALIVFMAVGIFRAVARCERRHGFSLPIIMFTFGIALMNVQTIAQTIMGYFTASTA